MQKSLLGHPVGLFIIFFTEMWERFSYYGMRALFVLFLTTELTEGGFGWDRPDALKLYSWYTSLVYLTPILGGIIADQYLGRRYSVAIGALLMTLGHASLAFEEVSTFYIGIGLLIIGNGFFKPNMSSMVGQLYPDGSPLKDSAYTIFYMGVNSGSFLGVLLCGYLGEKVGWNYGFGAAGIFMLFGLLQFWFGQGVFGNIGLKPEKKQADSPKRKALTKVETDRLIVIGVMAFFTIFFWLAFEQAGGTLNIFARDYTDRTLDTPFAANTYLFISLALSFIPMVILSWVLWGLSTRIMKEYPLTIIFTLISFLTIWGIIIWINYQNFNAENLEVPATWFGTLNAFFIITFAPAFSSMWMRLQKQGKNPSGPVKFAIGLFLLGLGFAAVAYGALDIPQGAETGSAAMIWLILAFFLHTMGELSLSPVGLSFVNKMSPKHLLGMMFGVWYVAIFCANLIAGQFGSKMDEISQASSLSGFFVWFVISSFVAGGLLLVLNKPLKKLMHGIE